MGTTTHQICFDHKKLKIRESGTIRLINENNNNIIKKCKSNRINISIRKSYINNNNIINKKLHPNSQINNKNNNNEQISKDDYTINNESTNNTEKNYKIFKKKRSHNSTGLPEINNCLSNITYKKGELKGKDKFSNVYKGLCTLTGEIITIKTYNNLSKDKKQLIMKNKEKLIKIEHPNIVKTINLYYENNGDLSIVYDYSMLQNIEQIINNFGTLNEKIIQIYSKQLLEALQYIHKKKIYHKNLKLNNILVDIDGTIKICDCLVDNLILGNEKEIYDNLLISNKIENYMPPFFIKYIKYFYKEDNNDEENKIKNIDEFEDWQSYDLWFLACIIIEVTSNRKPWTDYNFKNNYELFNFLKDSNSLPIIPKKLSNDCQELIRILLNPTLTNKKNIYDIIFNLNFFKTNSNNLNPQKTITNITNSIKTNDNHSQLNCLLNEESNNNINNNISINSGQKLGHILEKNGVINLLNSQNNPSFSVTISGEDISLNGSVLSNNLKNDFINKSDHNILNKIKSIKTIKSDMPEVKEEQIEQIHE